MNENELYVVKEYKFDNPLFHKVESNMDAASASFGVKCPFIHY